MKTFLAKLTLRKAIGLYIDEHDVVVSLAARTPLGPVELERQQEAYTPETLAEVVGRLLRPLTISRKGCSPVVALGIAPRRVFYSTRPVRTDSENLSAQVMLRDVLRSPNVCIDELAVEVVKGELGKRILVSVASCRKEYLNELLQILQDCDIQPVRTEPSPAALLRSGAQQNRGRRSKPSIRVFLGQNDALAVVAAGTRCIFWKSIKLPRGNELPALTAAIRSCQTLAGRCGIESLSEVAVMHGRLDLHAKLTDEKFAQKIGLPVMCCHGPELDGTAVAYGLALGCLQEQAGETLDMTRSITPPPSFWRTVPWGEAALQVALVVCMGLFMLTRTHSAEKVIAPVQAELQRHAWVGRKTQAELSKEKKELATKVDAIRKFMGSRIAWTKYLSDVSVRLPPSITLVALQGTSELEKSGKGKSKPKKSFVIRATAPITEDGTAPKEIDQFLAELRFHPLLQKDFPLVEVADIKTALATNNRPANALFTVVCLPKSPSRSTAAKGKKENRK